MTEPGPKEEPLFALRCVDCGWPINVEGIGQPVQIDVGEGEYVDGEPKPCEGLGGKHTVPQTPATPFVPTPEEALAGAIRLIVVKTLHELGVPMT